MRVLLGVIPIGAKGKIIKALRELDAAVLLHSTKGDYTVHPARELSPNLGDGRSQAAAA
jgi:hypothetical protein